ncbi:hypothetical protein HJFPF1_08815 [Paramyrothecium foliicola]|nr:hypothetical protein HJFPF1_08815 [Paramyrothecium foliicola]
MNPFKSRKKAKDDFSAPRPSVESETSSPFRMFGRKKSQDDSSKPELDLSTALPSNDDFRTSLLMTSLSTRFSMLREQDDPNTKVGKALDDSVLYPNRQSRLGEFGFGAALQDIAEVESIRAPYARTGSYHSSDDGASVNTSIMNRGKPIEGNTLFGGKQRVYKITPGSKNGRPVLQEDETSQSAFQKWRQAERVKEQPDTAQSQDELDGQNRESLVAGESEDQLPDVFESFRQTDRDRRRETASTTSSGPSAARNSTAATSITSSQPSSSVKEWQANVTPNVTTSGASVERSVTRARRLYEQGLNQDLHEQQSSALSRIDTLSKQRAFGARTPDLSPMANSPITTTTTTTAFGDRFADRRPLLAKASAPNLRSFTPPALNAAPMSPPEPSPKFPTMEQKPNFVGGVPPLSPPMSETEEQNSLPIQPAERSRPVAAMFSRPFQQYDETKYAQRARQLQQGRDSTGSRQRAESNVTVPTSRSASVASSHGNVSEKPEAAFRTTEPTVEEETQARTFFSDDDADSVTPSEVPQKRRSPLPLPQVVLERPNDHEHPALRKAGAPAPLNLASQETESATTASKRPGYVMASPKDESPEDSPTLGPNSGLSNMVRQHLRNTSTASSIYDPTAPEAAPELRLPQAPLASSNSGHLMIDTSCLDLTEADWDMAHGHRTSITDPGTERRTLASEASPAISVGSGVDAPTTHEQDDFARHLADGARRVREKLNSYVESDSGPPSPLAMAPSESTKSLSSALRPNPLGILKSKSSRGSLIDRDRNRESSPSLLPKPAKVLGLDTMSTSPIHPTANARDEFPSNEAAANEEARTSEEKENVHAGLRAFRQARRELQKMKELEAKQRHQPPPLPQQPTQELPAPPPRRQQTQDRGPPPSAYVRSPQDDSRSRSASRSESRASERDRSGSDTSNGGRSHSRPPRLYNGPGPYEEQPMPYGPGLNGVPRPNLTLRSPVPPGMENKRSPIMSPLHYGAHSPGGFNRPEASPSGRSPGRNMFEVSHDHAGGHRPHPIRNGSLPAAVASTPNLHSPTSAPPLPPINPRRKTRLETLTVDNGDELLTASNSPMSPQSRSKSPGAIYMSEDDGGPEQYRRRLRKVTSEASIRHGRLPGLNTSPPRRPPMPPLPVSAGPAPGNVMGNAF